MKKKDKKKVLALEAGGPCGISAIKLLRKNDVAYVIAADMDKHSPAFSLADESIVIPPAKDPSFAKTVDMLINEKGIDIVLPTFEHGHQELSKLNNKAFVTDFKSALLCKDKYVFNQECYKMGLPVPETRLMSSVSNIDSPAYIKPRVGVGSRDNYLVRNNKEYVKLSKFINKEDFLVQELLCGDHWNVDVLVVDGQFRAAIPRRDLKQKEGNCITVSIENYSKLISFSQAVQSALSINSIFNLEVFDKDGKFTINEVNVRFGGGVIFGALSGVDIVSYLVTRNERFLSNLEEKKYSRYYEEIEVGDKI